MRKAVVDLSSTRPIWSIPRDSIAGLRDSFGRGWEVVQVAAQNSNDRGEEVECSRAVQAAEHAEVYIGWGIREDVVMAGGEALQWVHTAAAGVRGSLTPALRRSRAQLTNSRGIHADPMADWVIAAIGFCGRGFHTASDAKPKKQWAAKQFTDFDTPVRELAGLRVGIVGFGGIGRAVARRCAALSMTVRAVKRRVDVGLVEDVEWVGGPGDLHELASQSDILLVAVPHTTDTIGLIDHSVLDALPDGAYVLNVARGALLDESALLAHLNSGHLGGCVLDVFAREPLPTDHPFWEHPQVFITPHVSGVSPRFWERETALISENVERYLRGAALLNVVDFEAGY